MIEPDKERVQQIMEKAVQDAEWVVKKVYQGQYIYIYIYTHVHFSCLCASFTRINNLYFTMIFSTQSQKGQERKVTSTRVKIVLSL